VVQPGASVPLEPELDGPSPLLGGGDALLPSAGARPRCAVRRRQHHRAGSARAHLRRPWAQDGGLSLGARRPAPHRQSRLHARAQPVYGVAPGAGVDDGLTTTTWSGGTGAADWAGVGTMRIATPGPLGSLAVATPDSCCRRNATVAARDNRRTFCES